jgi:glutamyl-tRNA reductase
LSLLLVGANHKTAPVEFREKIALAKEEIPELLSKMVATGPIREAMILSTCNRTEFLAEGEDIHSSLEVIREILASRTRVSTRDLDPYLYVLAGLDAVRHVFSVASSMDSMVVGEPQILGQVKEAYKISLQCRTAGPTINRLMHHAFRVSKRVRTETDIGRGAVSVAYAAVEMARHVFDTLGNKTALLVGAGEMIETAGLHLKHKGIAKTYVTNRTFWRAEALAKRLGGEALPFESLGNSLAMADMVLTCTGAPEPIITKEQVKAAMKARRNRPIFFIDIAVPRDVHPSVAELQNVFLYDLDDLQKVVDNNKAERIKELEKAGEIVAEEARKFSLWFSSLEAEPTIRELLEWAEEVRIKELRKTLKRLKGLDERELEAIDLMTKALIKKLFHRPIVKMKREGGRDGSASFIGLARELFGLDGRGSGR